MLKNYFLMAGGIAGGLVVISVTLAAWLLLLEALGVPVESDSEGWKALASLSYVVVVVPAMVIVLNYATERWL